MALKSKRDKGAVSLASWTSLGRFINKYMLVIIAIVLAIYLSVYPEVLNRIWTDLKSYSDETASGVTFESLFQAVLFLLCASYIVRKGKRFIESYLLSKIHIDVGVQHTILTLTGYMAWILIALMTLSVMGISLKNLAIVFGALSVGIGFGLQNVVNNFVSGLIILFERPIKEGDWVVINGHEGIVKNIRIRATELETFTSASVLIPNAEILSGNVINWTHSDMTGRIDIPVRVAYNSDLNKVKEILLEIANKNQRVLKNPAPYVWLLNFGDNAVELELRAMTAEVMSKGTIRSELMFQIFETFNREGIEIPFPKRVIQIHNEDKK